MLYEAKQGTKACEYIKSILDAEFEEHQSLHEKSRRSRRFQI